MALRNRKEVDESKLRGVEIVGEASEVEFGKFTNLQNWVPAQVYSIKKKRGVEAFESDPLSPDPLTNNCGLCPSDTVPDPQSLDWEECYDIGASPSGGISSNNRGQFHVIPSPAPGVNAIAFYGTADATGIPYPPDTDEAQVLSVTDGGVETTETPIALPSGDVMTLIRTSNRIGTAGHTDVLCYVIYGANYTPFGSGNIGNAIAFFNWEDQTAYIMEPVGQDYTGKWCKLGNDFYRIGTASNDTDLAYWDMSAAQYSAQAASRADVAGVGVSLRDVYRTANKLWAVAENGDLIELNPTTLATVNTYATGITDPDDIIGLHAASDTLFYICHEAAASSVTTIYMFELPSEDLTVLNTEAISSLGCSINISSGEPDGHTFHFAGGYFYFHSAGTTGATRAGRLGPVYCPGSDDLIIGGDGES